MNRRRRITLAGACAIGLAAVAGLVVTACSKAKPPEARKPASAAVAATASTLDNLQVAMARAANAVMRYNAFATRADEEGYKSVAALFRAAAASEAVHARKLGAATAKMGATPKTVAVAIPDVRSTKENLEAALKGEIAENEATYPAFAKQAEADKNQGALYSFKGALAAEAEHAKLIRQALADLDGWKAPGKVFAVCDVCGYTLLGEPPPTCPVCQAPKDKFVVVR